MLNPFSIVDSDPSYFLLPSNPPACDGVKVIYQLRPKFLSIVVCLQEELGIIVSMEDGLVLYITPGLTDVLGYPKDMWIGRSLIDLIHPKHRASFAGHITSVIANTDAGIVWWNSLLNFSCDLFICFTLNTFHVNENKAPATTFKSFICYWIQLMVL